MGVFLDRERTQVHTTQTGQKTEVQSVWRQCQAAATQKLSDFSQHKDTVAFPNKLDQSNYSTLYYIYIN